MPRSGQESLRAIGERVVLRGCELPQRRIADKHGIPIHVELRPGEGILKIILSFPLRHPDAFQVRCVAELDLKLRAVEVLIKLVRHSRLLHLHPGIGQYVLHLRLNHFRCLRRNVIRPHALESANGLIGSDQPFSLTDRLQRFRIQLDPIDGFHVGAAVIQIDTPVVILKERRIPERKAARHLFKGLCLRILRAVEAAVLAGPGSGQDQVIADRMYVRRIVVNRNLRAEGVKGPLCQIRTRVEAARHGREQPVFVPKQNQGGSAASRKTG